MSGFSLAARFPKASKSFLAANAKLVTSGVTTIDVSHRMPELFRLRNRTSVLRDGQYVGTLKEGEIVQDAVVRMMIGRSVEDYLPPTTTLRRRQMTAGRFYACRDWVLPGGFVG